MFQVRAVVLVSPEPGSLWYKSRQLGKDHLIMPEIGCWFSPPWSALDGDVSRAGKLLQGYLAQ